MAGLWREGTSWPTCISGQRMYRQSSELLLSLGDAAVVRRNVLTVCLGFILPTLGLAMHLKCQGKFTVHILRNKMITDGAIKRQLLVP